MLEQTEAIKLIVDTCMKVTPEDEVLVIADDYARPQAVAQAVAACARERSAKVVCMVVPPRKIAAEEPRKTTEAAMRAADVIFMAAERVSISGHSTVHEDLAKKGVRRFATNGVSEDYLRKSFSLQDIMEMKGRSERLAEVYTQADTVRLTTPHGTDLTFSIKGRRGTALNPISGIIVPDYAEAATAPVEGTAKGTIVFDGEMDGWGYTLSKPLVLKVVAGRVVDISGNREDADRLRTITAADGNANNIGEFAIGASHTVPGRLSGTRYDCAIIGYVHIGLGRNTLLGGATLSKIHIDGIMTSPTVELDGKAIVKDGQVLV
ncbi:MAG: hypothetical protein HYX92_11950 [Chloroflexi bacterium]|nr:hypothetical protein [Chloroflexota bacterium]